MQLEPDLYELAWAGTCCSPTRAEWRSPSQPRPEHLTVEKNVPLKLIQIPLWCTQLIRQYLTMSTNITYNRNFTNPQKWIPESLVKNSWAETSSPQVSLKKKTWLELIEKRVETPRVKENPAEVTMRTVERRTKNAGSSLAYWAFVSLKRQWTIKLKFQCKSRRAYLSILEIAVDLLRSVEKVEHLEKGNYSKMVVRQQCWPFATTCQSANSKSIWRKWNIRRRY